MTLKEKTIKKIKTSDLTLLALNWAVVKCERLKGNVLGAILAGELSPSTQWHYAGPIIEREGITTAPYSTHNGVVREWKAGRDWPMSHFPYYLGPTPLIAAMRCYVASKLGDEVDIPEELL
jgi:hypothetical protein